MKSQIETTFKINDDDTVNVGFNGIPIDDTGQFFSWLGTSAGINALTDAFILAVKESGLFPEEAIKALEQI
ncbi:hypothetical protein PROPHIGD54-2_93 [Mycobacterium phage prophiGD54-2]|uniref:hypothetical protein n=1 Tax=Mycobacteroides abscessus TaxID=36809 RepID=UPI0019D1C4E4|nr:hypothetical protein [Mycobacteroides abscessus]QSM04693.1 hypothetical protein PROPHIGD54-2_93 [Mycobacterium phage prophiGD54-2]QSN19613.1 hypothetical protein I3U41_17040 [Mycobacteroides abscessus subsp. abscessus]